MKRAKTEMKKKKVSISEVVTEIEPYVAADFWTQVVIAIDGLCNTTEWREREKRLTISQKKTYNEEKKKINGLY